MEWSGMVMGEVGLVGICVFEAGGLLRLLVEWWRVHTSEVYSIYRSICDEFHAKDCS